MIRLPFLSTHFHPAAAMDMDTHQGGPSKDLVPWQGHLEPSKIVKSVARHGACWARNIGGEEVLKWLEVAGSGWVSGSVVEIQDAAWNVSWAHLQKPSCTIKQIQNSRSVQYTGSHVKGVGSIHVEHPILRSAKLCCNGFVF